MRGNDGAKHGAMDKDVIILVRHGKPALSRKIRLTWQGYRDWWKQYDLGGLADNQKLPPKVKALAEQADIIFSSPMRRAVESARLASGRQPDIIHEKLIEAALPSPHLGPLKLRPKSWGTYSRIAWYFGWSDGMEPHKAARERANDMARELSEHAKGGKMVYVSAHGWFNRMLKGSLMSQGWKCVSQNGDLHWSHRRMERQNQEPS